MVNLFIANEFNLEPGSALVADPEIRHGYAKPEIRT